MLVLVLPYLTLSVSLSYPVLHYHTLRYIVLDTLLCLTLLYVKKNLLFYLV